MLQGISYAARCEHSNRINAVELGVVEVQLRELKEFLREVRRACFTVLSSARLERPPEVQGIQLLFEVALRPVDDDWRSTK